MSSSCPGAKDLCHARQSAFGHSAKPTWLQDSGYEIDDPKKIEALKALFSQSRVAVINGAAGTGKSTMVNHIATYFSNGPNIGASKPFLAQTNAAVGNLKRRVTCQWLSSFRTIQSHLKSSSSTSKEYDLLVIDEASTVSNADLVKILERTSFRLLVLVGDTFQIESIRFGNWFGLVTSFLPKSSTFKLTTPYRARGNKRLADLWDQVREEADDH